MTVKTDKQEREEREMEAEIKIETARLEATVALAEAQLAQARQSNEENKSAIIAAKKELRENTAHSIGSLWSSEDFEALAALSQYANPITDRLAEYEAVENKIARLENLIKSPYFARIDFRYDDDGMDTVIDAIPSSDVAADPIRMDTAAKTMDSASERIAAEKIYIGRTSLMKSGTYEMAVYDWRSPVAGVFYRFVTGQAFYEAPGGRITGELILKRQYEIKNSRLEYFFDADVQIVDEFLRKLLSQNTSTQMKTIVETIQKEQDIVIRDMENDLMMVQGVAGSGKTSIALHRAAYLMYQGLSARLSAGNIIIISPNTLFEQYIANVLPELGEDNVVSAVFEEMLAKLLSHQRVQTRNQFLEIMLTNPRRQKLMKSSIEFKTSRNFREILSRFVADIPHRFIDFANVYYGNQCIITKEAIKNKILSGRKTAPLGLRLKQMEEFILEAVKEYHKQYANKAEYLRIKSELQKMTGLDVKSLYGKLFAEEGYLRQLAGELAEPSGKLSSEDRAERWGDSLTGKSPEPSGGALELPADLAEIMACTRAQLATKTYCYDDIAGLAFLWLMLNGADEYKNIKQVVIDEAQDYYFLHYEIMRMLFPGAKFTILGDVNQTLEKPEDLTLYEQIGQIFNKKRATLVTMDKSFRCTNEILQFSSRFLPPGMEIKSFNRAGQMPQVFVAARQTELDEMIAKEAKVCREAGYQSVGLICKSEKNAFALYKSLKNKMDVRMIKNESTEELRGLFIIPVYMAKGLEFDAVLICDANQENYRRAEDKKLLYVACSRALHRLNLFGVGEMSPLL